MINRFRPFDSFYGMRKSAINLRSHSLSQHKNIRLVKDCAKKLNLKLMRFQTNNIFELYFDVFRGNKNICYISKGWDDPGFRIGDIITLDKGSSDFKHQFYEIFRLCSRDFINVWTCNPKNNKTKLLELSLEIGIYKDGFNEKVLQEIIKTFEDVVKKIQAYILL